MGPVLSRPGLRAGFAGLAVAGAALALSACSAHPEADDANLISGKQLFVQKCGSCHVLARAGTKGTTGPNLDEAFQQAIKDGMPRSDFAGAIHGQILHPNRNGVMPAKLVTGDQAYDIAAYVAQSVAAGGKDTRPAGHRRQAGRRRQARRREERHAPDRRRPDRAARLRDRRGARARPGRSRSRWPTSPARRTTSSSTARARARSSRTAASSQFQATFAAGSYTFYCSVPGPPPGRHAGQAHGQVAPGRPHIRPARSSYRSSCPNRTGHERVCRSPRTACTCAGDARPRASPRVRGSSTGSRPAATSPTLQGLAPDDGRGHRRDRRAHDPHRRPLAGRLRLVQLPRLRPRPRDHRRGPGVPATRGARTRAGRACSAARSSTRRSRSG